MDLGSTSDLTALGLVFREEYDWTVIPYFWIPEEGARKRERKDRVPYLTWAKQGWINLTSGNVTDYNLVRADLNKLTDQFYIKELAVDRLFQGAQLCTDLMQDGWEVIAFGQGFMSMAAPVKAVLELIGDCRLKHGGNPVLRWMASNVSSEQDAAGNLKWSKRKSIEKIDGIVAVTMGIGRGILDEANNVYDSRGILTLDNDMVTVKESSSEDSEENSIPAEPIPSRHPDDWLDEEDDW